MNDTILSGLVNLFALCGAGYNIDREDSKVLISKYLSRHFGIRNISHYLGLYEDLRSFYEEFQVSGQTEMAEKICATLIGKISFSHQAMLLLRLMEFCRPVLMSDNPNDSVFHHIAQLFSVSDSCYHDFIDFVNERKESPEVLIFPYEGTDGYLKTLRMTEYNKLVFAFIGNDTVMMNDVPVLQGTYQEWQQSSVLKSRHSQPLYYSTIISKYDMVYKSIYYFHLLPVFRSNF